MIQAQSYAWSSPYKGFWVEHFLSPHLHNLYGDKVVTEQQFRDLLLGRPERPDIFLMGNFVMDRAAIVSMCREQKINVAHCEDGFFPHYQTMHVDPLGFCWESSLSRMVFSQISQRQRDRAQDARQLWQLKPSKDLPEGVRPPYVLWPLQLIGDKVNHWDLAVTDWNALITHFRQCLPPRYQLVIKEHPKGAAAGAYMLEQLIELLPNTILVPRSSDLHSLLVHCQAAAGANSSVLYEARLMHHKPTYAYARGWFTNHEELFLPVRRQMVRPLPRLDWLDHPQLMRTQRLDDYVDWFLSQLLARQIERRVAQSSPEEFKERVLQLSYHNFLSKGLSMFD